MEERRQLLLNESVRNSYFMYSAGVTLALLLMTMFCAKQWIDQHRVLWITAEMMADLYNHDLHLAIGGHIIDGAECTNRHRFLRYRLGSSGDRARKCLIRHPSSS